MCLQIHSILQLIRQKLKMFMGPRRQQREKMGSGAEMERKEDGGLGDGVGGDAMG